MGEIAPLFLIFCFSSKKDFGEKILRAKYTTVKIPTELAAKLDAFASDLGYRSRAEIVNDAIRRFIDERSRFGTQEDRGS
jgi:Ribbon-helix-helix protein, copG family